MELSHIINELGENHEEYFNAIAPPIIQTSNFLFRSVEKMREALQDEYKVYLYSRGNNPTVNILRKKLAALDGAEDAIVLSSGVAATFLAVFSNVKSGDHIICVAKPYSWTDRLLNSLLPRFGVTATMIDGTKVENFENAIQPNTKIIYLESPNTFTFELQDLAAVSKLALKHGILTMIDNTYCSPLYQKPIDYGIDLVIQTGTKYLGGHSDVVSGVVCGSQEMIGRIFRNEMLTVGSVISPFNAWLLLRSLRTMEVRLEHIAASTEKVEAWVEKHPKVEKVYYPFSKTFSQYELAKLQMKKSPGLFTVVMRTKSVDEIEKFCNSLKHFRMAVSWGGHESLIIPTCCTFKKEDFDPNNSAHRLVRFYIGLEDADYLIKDIEQAFANIN